MSPDFKAALKAVFTKHEGPATAEPRIIPICLVPDTRRFNVVKVTETDQKVIAFGITIKDALRGINGRYNDTPEIRYRIIPMENLDKAA